MTETQWRFLKAIADRLPEGRIVEVRLFPAIKQGGAESGVAVVAVEALDVVPAPVSDEATLAPVPAAGATDQAPSVWEPPRLTPEFSSTLDGVPGHPSAVEAAGGELERTTVVHADVAGVADLASAEREVRVSGVSDREVPLAVAADDTSVETDETVSLDDMLDLAAADATAGPGKPSAPKRYAVLAARYRLTLKGPDRGHWDFELTHEADAPLETVDRVARGVARRAGDAGEPESFSAVQLHSALSQPWWSSAT